MTGLLLFMTTDGVMAEYQKIEYRIGKDGKVIETVLNATGASCTDATVAIEQSLGSVESQALLPEYYEGEETSTTDTIQLLHQNG